MITDVVSSGVDISCLSKMCSTQRAHLGILNELKLTWFPVDTRMSHRMFICATESGDRARLLFDYEKNITELYNAHVIY